MQKETSQHSLTIEKFLDQGGQNRIYLAKNQQTGQYYITKTPKIEKNPNYKQALEQEEKLLQRVSSISGVVKSEGI